MNTKRNTRFLAFVITLFLVGCVRQPSQNSELVIAKVNGDPVPLKEFLVNFQQLKGEQDEISQKNPKLLEQLKTRALNEVIIMSVLRQQATKRKLHIAKEEVEGRLANWREGYPAGGFQEMLRKQNTTEDFLKKRIEDQLLIEKITSELFESETRVSDDEMKTYYQLHQDEFTRPERLHVLQILIPTKPEAEKIRQEVLASKVTFESATRQYSQSPDATKGGDLGFFARNEKIAAFNEAFNLPIGTISKPIQSPYGFHLLKTVEREPSKKLNYNESKNDIVKALKRMKEVRVYKEWITKLLKDGEIYRNEALFSKQS